MLWSYLRKEKRDLLLELLGCLQETCLCPGWQSLLQRFMTPFLEVELGKFKRNHVAYHGVFSSCSFSFLVSPWFRFAHSTNLWPLASQPWCRARSLMMRWEWTWDLLPGAHVLTKHKCTLWAAQGHGKHSTGNLGGLQGKPVMVLNVLTHYHGERRAPACSTKRTYIHAQMGNRTGHYLKSSQGNYPCPPVGDNNNINIAFTELHTRE